MNLTTVKLSQTYCDYVADVRLQRHYPGHLVGIVLSIL